MSTCPTCGQTTTDADDERAEEVAPVLTPSQVMDRSIRQRANGGSLPADFFTRGRPPGGDAA
ncbi:MAG: hypothetical protein WKF86_07765 [Acidimicrobiales bacterium]